MRSMSTSTLIAGSLLGLMISTPALATCSAEPMMASICITAANFCPRGYLPTNGQILSISQNSALFALLGTTYGGNGVSTFALPNLQSRVPVGAGQGPGLNQVTARN
jgi:microcystin-dependent protein